MIRTTKFHLFGNTYESLNSFNGEIHDTSEKVTEIALKETSSLKIFPIDTILVAMYGGFNQIGRTGILKINACVNQALTAIQTNKELSPNFLISYLNYKVDYWKEVASSSRKDPNITSKDIKDFPIPIPPTKAEQTAIATALNDADGLITQLEQLIAKKRAVKQGAMQVLLQPKADWELKKLGEVATLKARIGWQGLTTAEYRKSGDYFLITGTEFSNGYIDWDSCFYVDENRYKQDKNIQVKQHDVLVTKDGTIGKVAFIKNVPKPATLNSGVFVIRPVNNAFHPAFFYYLLLSEVFQKFLSQLSAGSTISHLYQKDFVTFEFKTPPTLAEQTRIARILSDMDGELSALEGQLAKWRGVKAGMMGVLLTGRVRLV